MFKKSYIKTILTYFQKMDIEKLFLCLKDEYSYQDTTKEIFLNEVQRVFKSYIKSGDTDLIIYPGICNALSKLCDGCGKKGYRFVGNNSKNYIDFIFEVEGDDIKDIYNCSIFKTNEDIINLGNQECIYINEDDKITFNKSPEYWVKVNSANSAYSEIITTPARILDFEELDYWVEKHSLTNNKIGSYDFLKPVMKWTSFLMLYDDLKGIRDYIFNHIDDFEIAMTEYENANNDEQYIEWFLKFETLYLDAPFVLKFQFDSESDYFIFQDQNPIYFCGVEFKKTLLFLKKFNDKESELLSKYFIYTQEETEFIYNIEAFHQEVNINSLKFHLNIRKTLEDIGIIFPYFLIKSD